MISVPAAGGSKLVFTQSPSSSAPGTPFATQPQVTVEDATGQPVTSDSSMVTLSISPGTGPGTLSGCQQAESNGVVSFSGCQIDLTGTGYQLHATDGTLSAADSNPFDITGSTTGPATQLVFTTNPGGATSSAAFTTPPSVTIEDASNNHVPISGVGITLSITGSTGAALTGCTAAAITNGTGVANFSGCEIDQAGTYTLTATSTSPNLTGTSASFTVNPGTATKILLTGGASLVSGSSETLSATIQDTFGNPVTSGTDSSATVTFSKASGTGTVTGLNSVAASGGTATLSITGGTAGTVSLAAGATLNSVAKTSNTLTVTVAPPPNKLVITTAARSGTASTSATIGAITVQQQTPTGTPVNAGSGGLTVALTSDSPGSSKFASSSNGPGVTSVTIPSGNSSVSFFYGDTKAGSPTITVASVGLTFGTQAETVTPAAANKLAITTPPVSGSASTSPTLGPITVQTQDQFGNPVVGGRTVNLASTAGATAKFSATSAGSATTSVSISAGNSSTSFFYADTKPGSPTITASTSSGPVSATQVEAISVGAGSQLAITSNSVSGAASSSATVGPITVQLQDQVGNPVTAGPGGTIVDLVSNSSGAVVFATTSGGSATTSVTIPSGSTSVTFFYGDTKFGAPTVTASASGLSSDTQAETITAAAVSKLAFTSAPISGGASSSAALGPLTVQAQDQFGNPVVGARTVTVASSSAGAKFATTFGGSSVNSVSIIAGQSTANFFYGDTVAGSPLVTIGSGALNDGTQTETILPAFTISSVVVADGGGHANKPEVGDTISISYSQPVDLSSVCAGWTSGPLTGITVTMNKGNGQNHNDLTFNGCGGNLNLASGMTTSGSLWVTGNANAAWASSSMIYISATNTLQLTLGGAPTGGTVGTANPVTATASYAYTPDPALKDTAGVAVSGTQQSATAVLW
jgi:hypothetical protein